MLLLDHFIYLEIFSNIPRRKSMYLRFNSHFPYVAGQNSRFFAVLSNVLFGLVILKQFSWVSIGLIIPLISVGCRLDRRSLPCLANYANRVCPAFWKWAITFIGTMLGLCKLSDVGSNQHKTQHFLSQINPLKPISPEHCLTNPLSRHQSASSTF